MAQRESKMWQKASLGSKALLTPCELHVRSAGRDNDGGDYLPGADTRKKRPAGRFVQTGGFTPSPLHPMCKPPLQEKSAPVVKPESSPASQATMAAISSGVPRRLMGIVATIFSSTSGLIARTMSVPM